MPGYNVATVDGAIQTNSNDKTDDGGVDPYMRGTGIIRSGVADPASWKAVCDGKTAATRYYDGYRKACNMFNIYEVAGNGQAQGYQCAYYNAAYGDDHATNVGQYNSEGHLTVIRSWTYVANPYNDPAYVVPPVVDL